jgi:hypothetical protein
MPLVRSIVLSILASVTASYLLRLMMSSTSGPLAETGNGGAGANSPVVVVVIPVIAGNNANKMGWFIERRPFWSRRRKKR